MSSTAMTCLQNSVIVAASAIALLGAITVAGAHVNTTPSIPRGLYWETSAPLTRGAYVLLCLPDGPTGQFARSRGYIASGHCPGGYGFMMKRVAALGGDHAAISAEGIEVNGRRFPDSRPLPFDVAGRPLPRVQMEPRVLRDTELLVIGDTSPQSYDSRYFGPLTRPQVQAVLQPVFTW